jgi:hypothetical protein
MHKENRRRTSLAIPFILQFDSHVFLGTTCNISMNGVYLRVQDGPLETVKAGNAGSVQLRLGDVFTAIPCHIMRIYGRDMALQFGVLEMPQKILLRSLLGVEV